jgi:hypothetical protein
METMYLGDGAYVEHTGYSFIVYTHNGVERTNEVVLEPEHLNRLNEFAKRIYDQRPA